VSNGNVEALAFAPDGSLLLACTWDGHVYVWDTASRTGRHLVAGERILTSVAIAPDAAEVAAVGLDGSLWLWPTPRTSSRLLAHYDPGAIYFAIDDAARRIAYGARDRRFHLDDVEGGAPRVLAEDIAVHKVAFVPGADALVALQSNKSVERWDLASGARETLTDTGDGINEYLRISRDGSLLASVHTANSLWLYDLRERKLRCRWPGNKLRHFALAPDGKQIYWASGEQVKVGDTSSCAERTLYVGDRDVSQIVVSPDGTKLAWSRLDGVVGQHDLASGKLLTAKAHRYDSDPLAYSPDGTHLASGGDDGLVVLWRSEGLVVEHLLRGHEAQVRAVRFSPDGRTLVSFAYDGTLRTWDVASGEGRVYRGHNGIVVEGFFAGDGRRFVTSAVDGNLRLWTFDAAGALPHTPEALRAWMDEATTARLVDGRALSP
jgi:WD40 repeat protein